GTAPAAGAQGLLCAVQVGPHLVDVVLVLTQVAALQRLLRRLVLLRRLREQLLRGLLALARRPAAGPAGAGSLLLLRGLLPFALLLVARAARRLLSGAAGVALLQAERHPERLVQVGAVADFVAERGDHVLQHRVRPLLGTALDVDRLYVQQRVAHRKCQQVAVEDVRARLLVLQQRLGTTADR